jgi:hypothetical protein
MDGESLFVLLQSRGNPDFRQDPERPLSPEVVVAVGSLAAAASACREYIGEWDLGGGNWTGGKITNRAGDVVGKVSYNGRVFSPGPWQDARLLYDPYQEKADG